MALGRLEATLSRTDKRASKNQLGYCPVISMLRNLKVLLGQTGITAGIQVDQTTCLRAFADGFHNQPAGSMMAFSDHT